MQMSRNVKLINIVLLKSSTNQANLQANTNQRFRAQRLLQQVITTSTIRARRK